jgi:hypothetical protein
MSSSLHVREFFGKWFSPRESPTPAAELWEFLIYPVAKTLRGEVEQSMECGTVKVHIPGVEQACGECDSVSSGHNKAPGEKPSSCTVKFPMTSA